MLLLKMTCKNAAKNNALVTVKCCSVNDEDAAFSASHQHVIFSLSAAHAGRRDKNRKLLRAIGGIRPGTLSL